MVQNATVFPHQDPKRHRFVNFSFNSKEINQIILQKLIYFYWTEKNIPIQGFRFCHSRNALPNRMNKINIYIFLFFKHET